MPDRSGLYLMAVLFSILCSMVFSVLVLECHKSNIQQLAIDANVARWVVDGKTGYKTLEYGCE